VTHSDTAEAKLRELFAQASADVTAGPARFRAVVTEMYRAYKDEVPAAVRSRVPKLSESRIEDVCGATWEVIPKALEGFRGESSFYTWLLHIAANKALDDLRRKDNRNDALPDLISKLIAFQAPSQERPSRKVAREEMNQVVKDIIAQLEPDDRELLLLHYGEGQSAADIARARGLPPNTVAQRLVRTRNRVKKLCEAAGIG
jgi:RNA polymerase sigma-70 factor (ECF subfamily)